MSEPQLQVTCNRKDVHPVLQMQAEYQYRKAASNPLFVTRCRHHGLGSPSSLLSRVLADVKTKKESSL
ncbi:SRSF protein kinase 3 [Fusarium oxysporum f. sp. albedinis]|nr:SRSF protein kinase 3 [Fusarium oxysporum f. sp. albedinis]